MAEFNFLGQGIISPFRRTGGSDLVSAGEAELVKSAIREILGTIRDSATSSGELPWDTEFGSKLFRLKHKNLEGIEPEARFFIIEALREQEPRARITRVEVDKVEDQNLLRLRIFFSLITENVPGNEVLIPEETVEVTV